MSKKLLNDCALVVPITGVCKIDIEKAKKYFTNTCIIYRNSSDEYLLIRYTPKRRLRRLKITISLNDAQELINSLSLVEHSNSFSRLGRTYKMHDAPFGL